MTLPKQDREDTPTSVLLRRAQSQSAPVARDGWGPAPTGKPSNQAIPAMRDGAPDARQTGKRPNVRDAGVDRVREEQESRRIKDLYQPKKTEPVKGQTTGRLLAMANKQGGEQPVQFKQMDEETYAKLDARSKGAVDANTMLEQAIAKDKALLGELDSNGDGRVSVREARTAGPTDNYRSNYESVFGKGESDERLNFAPNTVAALGALGTKDDKGTIESYLSGDNLITDQDLSKGLNVSTERRGRVATLPKNMIALQESLAAGRQVLLDRANPEQMGTMIDSLREGMLRGSDVRTVGQANSDINLNSLVDPEYRNRQSTMSQLYNAIMADNEVPLQERLAYMQDDMQMSELLRQYDIDGVDEWKKLLASQTGSINAAANAYQSTAGNQ